VEYNGPAGAPYTAPQAQAITRTYYYAGAQLIAMRVLTGTTGNTLYYLHADHLGSTSLTTDASGNVVARQSYYPYGSVRSGGGLPTDITFTGHRSESGLGSLMHFNARMYSPLIGRFISPDTIVPEPGNPQALNRYAYVLGNPLRYTDPSGHDPCGGPGVYVPDCGVDGWGLKPPRQPKAPSLSNGSSSPISNTPSGLQSDDDSNSTVPTSLLGRKPDPKDTCFASPTQCIGPQAHKGLQSTSHAKRPTTAQLVVIGVLLTSAIVVSEIALTAGELALAPIAATGNPLAIGGELILTGTSLFLVDVEISYWVYVYRVETALPSQDVKLNLNPLELWGLSE
jgi:RHS repeat-associated protein